MKGQLEGKPVNFPNGLRAACVLVWAYFSLAGPAWAGTGSILHSDAVEAEFGDSAGGFGSSNAERMDHLYWIDSQGLRSGDLAQVIAGPACTDAAIFAGQSFAYPDGHSPVIIAQGSLSSVSALSSASMRATTVGLLCGRIADATAQTDYRVFPGDNTRRNLLRVLRTFNFSNTTPSFDSSGLRPWAPRLALNPYRTVLYPNASGSTITRLDAGNCTSDCEQSNWNGRWFANDDGQGRGVMVIRNSLSKAPATLVVRSDGQVSNFSSPVLLQPAAGWRAAVSEIEYLCFYDPVTWPAASQAAGQMPQGCTIEPLSYNFGVATAAATFIAKTSNTLTISDLSQPAPILISNGSYRINNGAYVQTPGTVNPGDQVTLSTVSGSTPQTSTQAIVEIGGKLGIFEVVTGTADTAPDAFAFSAIVNAPVGSLQTSAPVAMVGINAPSAISISGSSASYSINGAAFTTATGTVQNGDQIRVQLAAATAASTLRSTTVTVGRVTARFDVTTAAPDITPDAFGFQPVYGVAPRSVQTSNTVTITGIDTAAAISIRNGAGNFSVNGGPFTSASSKVTNGATVSVRVNAASTTPGQTYTTLTIGTVSANFNVSTGPAPDSTPDAFSFAPLSNVAQSSVQTSNPVTVGGINIPAPISVAGGSYSVDGGAFTTDPGMISNGSVVQLRVQASSALGTTAQATVTIGGVSAAYSVSTPAIDSIPDAFGFAPVFDAPVSSLSFSDPVVISGINAAATISIANGSYSIDGGAFTTDPGTVTNGSVIRIRVQASSSLATLQKATITVGGVSSTYSVTTTAIDSVPDAFSFASASGVAQASLQTSDPVVIAGIDNAVPVAISGGSYSLDGGAFTTAPGTVVNGSVLRIQVQASSATSTTTQATVTVGGFSASYAVTTTTIDVLPGAFRFVPSVGLAPGVLKASGSVIVSDVDQPVPITVTDGMYNINAGPYTDQPGFVGNGDAVKVRRMTASTFDTTNSVTATIGGVSATFYITTRSAQAGPSDFSFPSSLRVPLNTEITSAPATITIEQTAPLPISIDSGSYSINGGPYTSSPGVISGVSVVTVKLTSSSFFDEERRAQLTVGSVTQTFLVSTVEMDNTPDYFSFNSMAAVAKETVQTSNTVTISAINVPAAISITGGSYSVDGGAYTNAAGFINSGSTVSVQTKISGSATSATAVLTVGGSTGTFALTTAASDTTPSSFSFPAQVNVGVGKVIGSASVKISGINAATPVSIQGGSYKIGSGALTTQPGFINLGQSIGVSLQASSKFGETTEAFLNVGGVVVRFAVTTAALVTPSITPASGTFAGPQTVTMAANNGSAAGGQLYYTTDGTAPTTSSIPYYAPFTVSSTQTIRVALLTPDGQSSSALSRTYVIYAASTAPSSASVQVTGFNLNKWRLDMPTGNQNNPDSISPAALAGGYSNPPYYYANADGSLTFFCPVTGFHTSGTSYPRTEFREMNLDGSLGRWFVGQRAQGLNASFAVTQVPSKGKTVVGQIHADTTAIAEAEPLVKLVYEGDQGQPGLLRIVLRIKPTDSDGYSVPILTNVPWQSTITYHINVSLDGVLTVTANGNVVSLPIDPSWNAQGLYFKAGNYVQDNTGPDSEAGNLQFFGITVDP